MEVLNNPEELETCPYNVAHRISKSRFSVHIAKCRRQFEDTVKIMICDFDKKHRIPAPELQYHHEHCPSRKVTELSLYTEDSQINTTSNANHHFVSVPVDPSWDDLPVASYEPEKYCENKEIIRSRIGSAAQRRDFRLSERRRVQNLPTCSTSNRPEGGTGKSNRQVFKAIPAQLEPEIENAPLEVVHLMQKVSKVPERAIIPKLKNS